LGQRITRHIGDALPFGTTHPTFLLKKSRPSDNSCGAIKIHNKSEEQSRRTN
jgi:hypothetical protein